MSRTLEEVQSDIADVRQAIKNTLVAVEQSGSGGRRARRAELSELRAYLEELQEEENVIRSGGRQHTFKQGRVVGGW